MTLIIVSSLYFFTSTDSDTLRSPWDELVKSKIISSVIASTGNAGQSNYAASKSGLIGLYKSLALEFAKRNININIVSPGFISSPMTDKLDEKQKNNILSKIPMQRFGKPEDVADLVHFLSQDISSYITGQNFNINGGMLMP